MKKDIIFRMVAYTDAAGKFTPGAPGNGNEDNFYVDDNLSDDIPWNCEPDKIKTLSDCGCLMVVADGMGGMNAGEVASKIAIDTVSEYFAPGKITKQIAFSHKNRKRYMENVIVEADNRIKKESKINEEHRGMGSTIIMAWIVGNELTLSWCGDSRAYRYNEAIGIVPLSKDHSYVQGLVDKNIISYDDAFDHPQSNIVTNSLGDSDHKAEPETRFFNVYNSDIILLCSDGLSGVLRDKKTYDADGNLISGDTIEDVIAAHHNTLTECREALWAAAERADWYDNVTVVLCEIMSGAEECPAMVEEKEQEKKILPAIQKSSIVNIKLGKKGIIVALVTLLLLIAITAGVTWRLFSAKESPTAIQEETEEYVGNTTLESTLSPEIITLQSKLLGRVKVLRALIGDAVIDKLQERINQATDSVALAGINNEITLWEQKAPLLKEIEQGLSKQKGSNALKAMRTKVITAKSVDKQLRDEVRKATNDNPNKEAPKSDKKDKAKSPTIKDSELTPSIEQDELRDINTKERLSKQYDALPDIGYSEFIKGVLNRYKSEGVKAVTSIQLIMTDKDNKKIINQNGIVKLGDYIKNAKDYDDAVGKPAMVFLSKKERR